jgi:putative ABC transport system permease protein
MIRDYVRFALTNFKERRLRTFLTALGIIIGIAAIVGLISIGQGLENTIIDQFEALGGNKLIVTPKGGIPGTGAPVSDVTLDESDLDTVRKSRGIDEAGGMLFKLATVDYRSERKDTFVSGIPQDETKDIFTDINSFDVVEGRELTDKDGNTAIIGILLWEGTYFDKPVALRDKILINDVEFKVVGVLNRIGNPADDSQILIPLESARELFDEPTKVDFVMASVTDGSDPTRVAEVVKRNLRKHRNLEEDKEDFEVQTFEQILETFSEILTVVQAILIGIAAISLIVGGVGIMNTMYTSVIQRTREIGVMKAIGARNIDITLLFLIESGFLGLGGGVIGVLIGLSMGKLVEGAAALVGLPFGASFSPTLIGGALLFSFLVGALAGIAPSYSASRLKPVDALRYE